MRTTAAATAACPATAVVDGRIGIHGTRAPSSIGHAVSHGCVRGPDDVVRQLAEMLPLGTPVVVS